MGASTGLMDNRCYPCVRDEGADEPMLTDASPQFLGGRVRVVEGQRCETPELVLVFGDLAGRVVIHALA
jgi:hypothetical protein